MGKHSPSAIASGAGFAADIWIRIDKAVKKGVINRGTADRKKSRLAIALNKATAAAPAK